MDPTAMHTDRPVLALRGEGCSPGSGFVPVLALSALLTAAAMAMAQDPNPAAVPAAVAAPGVPRAPIASPPPAPNPFAHFDLPDAWEVRYWSDPGVKALLGL